MKKLRDRDALRRHAQVDQRALESLRELETRIGETMDRWGGQVKTSFQGGKVSGGPEAFGYAADRIHSRYGLLLVA